MANQFLTKETMAAMRSISAAEITALQNGTYEGVQLLGYYQKGDTPAPIFYYLAPMTPDPGTDDGGSVIKIGSLTLIHAFTESDYNRRYFGDKFVYSFDGYKNLTTNNSSESKLIRMPNGNIMLVYRKCPEGYHNNNNARICCQVSTDEGLTWGEEQLIIDPQFDPRNFVVGTCGNNISIIYRLMNVDTSSSTGCFSIFSSDNGSTWSNPIILNPQGTRSVVPFGKVLQRGNNFVFLMYAQQNPNSQAHLYKSTDNGMTWNVDREIYNLPAGNIIAEPVLEDMGEYGSIILARVSDNSSYTSSVVQLYSSDGLNFENPKSTNISIGYLAQCPAWVDYLGDGYIIVYSNRRPFQVSSHNLSEKLYIYISKITEILLDSTSHELKYEIPRPYPNRFSTYGYPATLKTVYGYIGTITERRGVDETVKTMSSAYENEADNVVVFRLLLQNYIGKYNTYGERASKNTKTGSLDFISIDSDVRQQEAFSEHIWKANVVDPQSAGVKNSNGKIVSLQSFNHESNVNWPQSAQGGIVMLAQSSSEQGISWMIGRGNSNNDIGSLFCNTMQTGTRTWSGWRKMLTENDNSLFMSPMPSQSSWTSINKNRVSFNSAGAGAPISGTNMHGFYIPQANDFNNGTRLMMRGNRFFIQSFENGVDLPALEIITKNGNNFEATTATKGLVNQAVTSSDSAVVESSTYSLVEIQGILAELRDLKTKLRTAGILAK